ncbi:MAG: hypothetical protein C5S43_01450 [Candidatus Methanocomedens sp.]|nr:MAG: hypothetical protein C5S43_01450 [ANME-2 cluster archaeon]
MLHNLKHLKILLITVLLIFALSGSGCLGNKTPEPINLESGHPSGYELDSPPDDVTNLTTFFLFANKTIKAVTIITNTPSLDIFITADMSRSTTKKEPDIGDIVVLGSTSPYADHSNPGAFSNVSFNSTYTSSQGKNTIHFDFAQPVTGFVAYSYALEQGQFYHFLSRNETVIVVLPEGYDTGNFILGPLRPKPDSRSIDIDGRVKLRWDATSPIHNYIKVTYYKSSLPTIMGIMVIILGAAGLATAIYFNSQIRKLRQMRESMESDVKK